MLQLYLLISREKVIPEGYNCINLLMFSSLSDLLSRKKILLWFLPYPIDHREKQGAMFPESFTIVFTILYREVMIPESFTVVLTILFFFPFL